MYAVRLADFEGPLDLLLFFIRRDELDIHDIPIAQIADEYLAYVRVLDEVDLDGAGEFVYMAALLISIKTQMLLPRPAAEDGEEAFDPRKELVDRLLEYMRFKEAAGELAFQEGQRAALYARQSPAERKRYAGSDDFITYDYSVFQLVSALKRVLDRAADEEPEMHVVQAESYSVEDQRTFVLDRVRAGGR
ncbi:MAG: segregation/condensation protein A, partial [Bacteroidota bacterium]